MIEGAATVSMQSLPFGSFRQWRIANTRKRFEAHICGWMVKGRTFIAG